LKDAVLSTLLLAENVESFRLVSRSDNSVGNFSRDDLGGRDVASVRESDEVTERGHTISSSSTSVSARDRGEGSETVDVEDLDFFLREG
jgi:hypothetical protein